MDDNSDERLTSARIAIEEVYETGGLSQKCFSGLSNAELDFLNTDEHGGKGAHVYGDTEAGLILHLFENILGRNLMAADVFCDLGSGSGKLCHQMVLETPAAISGIELAPARHEIALAASAQLRERGALSSEAASRLSFCCGSMLHHDAAAAANLLFCYNPNLSSDFLTVLRAALSASLHPGAVILMRGQPFPQDTNALDSGHTRIEPMLETRIVNRVHQCASPHQAPKPDDCTHLTARPCALHDNVRLVCARRLRLPRRVRYSCRRC